MAGVAGGVGITWPSKLSAIKPSSSKSKHPLSPHFNGRFSTRLTPLSCQSISMEPNNTTHYEFSDGSSDLELRVLLKDTGVQSSKEIQVDVDESSLAVRIKQPGSITTLMETKQLYDRIKPGETIWYLDEDQLVINLRKQDQELKWPDIMESWESLSTGVFQLLKGTSIYIVGDSTEINQKVAEELAVGLRYTPLDTKGLLETFGKQSIESWVNTDGSDAVAEAEAAVLESLSSHVRAVVATLGGKHGAAGRADKWRHLYAGLTVWLSQSAATDEYSAKEEAKKQVYEGSESYSKADVVVKFDSWDACYAKAVAQASLSALKQLILSDKKLPGKKSLYIRLGCRGDWPNIKPPGWDPSSPTSMSTNA
ncbi:probable inactive shikimate kinase like 2, chloroplastic isoform X2 [Chenopodium quinoa]|uniref:probable inactive shikimate kinase like 2, chloroplastic isoform X2 n=1 Tax=Chenopodium quinoa TaxID=63459 RepID=UPI000B783D12|nr:probable inactive shikimate kinase like 2, chloroplastic isoform X2 [Chenopodium quinoa]